MAKGFKDSTGGRDYGRKPYMSDQPHSIQMRLQTDTFVNRYGKRPHSEDKKPYLPGLEFPEMEHYHTRWDPRWPPFDPPTEPDVPGEPGDPDNPTIRPNWPPPPPPNKFLGCHFIPHYFIPVVAVPGELAYAKFITSEEDAVKIEVDGPITPLSTIQQLNGARQRPNDDKPWFKGSTSLFIRVNDVVGEAPRDGFIHAFVNVEMESGQRCSAGILILPCKDIPKVAWDWDNSVQVIGAPGSGMVWVYGGKPPYRWSVSGAGFSLAEQRTSVPSNTLSATAGACGTARIAVRDSCNTNTKGSVRSINGQWVAQPPETCLPACLGQDYTEGSPWFYVTRGGDRCQQMYAINVGSCGASQCSEIACGNCDNAFGLGRSCASYCSGAQCTECIKFDPHGNACGKLCTCQGPCPGGVYLNLTCWQSTGISSWKWEC